MFKLRYETATGKVNLITSGTKEIPVKGCKYMSVASRPRFDDRTETVYIRDGKLVAIDDTHQPPLHRIIG